MIKDEKLKIVSLAVALAGLALIFIVSAFTGPQSVEISGITENDAGRIVLVNGTINSYSTSNGNIFIDFGDDTGTINVVMFERTGRGHAYSLKNGDNVTVTGQVSIYKNELEIIANSIDVR